MGSCGIFGKGDLLAKYFLCTNMSSTLEQKVQFFDHILGVQDVLTVGTGGAPTTKKASSTTGGAGGKVNVQKKAYRYMPAIAKARMDCPVMGGGTVPSEFEWLLNKAISGEDIEVVMTFWKNLATKVWVRKAKITSFTISMKAGEVVSFSCEITGAEYDGTFGSSTPVDCTKLVTWDRCTVQAVATEIGNLLILPTMVASFDLTINNPPIPIYTAKWSDSTDQSHGLMPQKIRLGIQEVSGTISFLDSVASTGGSVHLSGAGYIKFGVDVMNKKVNVVFLPPTDQANGGLYIQTVNFTGASDDVVWPSYF